MYASLFELLEVLLQRKPEVFAAGIVGVLLGAGLVFAIFGRSLWDHWIGCRARREKLNDLTLELEKEREQAIDQDNEIAVLKQSERDLRAEIERQEKQIQDVLNSDGRIWEAAIPAGTRELSPKSSRSCRYMSVVNLKGGVGKTTLTANVGYALAKRGLKTLLIDLDHQGSLTSLCLSKERIHDSRRSNRLIDYAYASEEADLEAFRKSIERVCDRVELHLVGAGEDLQDAETQNMARWLINKGNVTDARFRLRELIDAPPIRDEFDWVLMDCPPRLTTSCINALACSDYVLIPVKLDETSLEAIPRMLRWLQTLRDASLCPQLRLMGVVANEAKSAKALTTRENAAWSNLKHNCDVVWDESIYRFERFVPDTVKFQVAANSGRRPFFAAEQMGLEALFDQLAKELSSRVPAHARV